MIRLDGLRASELMQALLNKLAEIDAEKIVCPDDDPGFADRDRAFEALGAVLTFLSELNTGSRALIVLGQELLDLHEFRRHGPLLAAAKQGKRNRTPMHIVRKRAHVAVIVELRKQRTKTSRKKAAKWVELHLPDEAKSELADGSSLTVRAVENWHDRCRRRPKNEIDAEMREAYDALLSKIRGLDCTEARLLKVLREGLR